MKTQEEIEKRLRAIRADLPADSAVPSDIMFARVGTLLWVLEREDESLQGKVKEDA